ncbi:hypothetical protein GON26_20505 [Flavobacterium sp. GA093]|uniref:Lipoprotein n=1 Tax=Flavobacterium hydrocarbonoxydans TaxID=2683249 RepID=A0A6I4NR95_9FLAO|nr:hypothetical protein [Flavobacterium hydrocarbonoxydans]MWB96750.1 hypothetical protein [Flavobacterium hydrocarbonoxydans]
MYKKTLLLLVFMFSCLLISCRTTRQETHKTDNQTQITSEKVVVFKDTTLYAPRAETEIKIPLESIKNQPETNSTPIVYEQKNGQAKVKFKIVHDTISITASCDSLAIVAKIKREFRKESSKQTQNSSTQSKEKTGYSLFHIVLAFLLGFATCYVIKFFKIV